MPRAETLDELMKEYIEHLQLKGYAAGTLRQNIQMLSIFTGYLESRGIGAIGTVTIETLEDYKGYLREYKSTVHGRPLKSSTVVLRLMAVRNFIRYLVKRGVIYRDITEGWKMPKETRSLPRGVMSVDEISRVMKQPDLRTTLGYRDRAMLEVLYATGVRAGELINLTVQDVNLEKKLLRIVKGKGGKDRYVLLNTPSRRFLLRYIEVIRPVLVNCPRPGGKNWEKRSKTGEDNLFLTVYGGKMTLQGLSVVMRKYLKKAKIKKDISPCHSFRHSVATHLLESGMDIRYVQVFLGHETIQTTQVYTHVEIEKLRQMIRRYHPQEINFKKIRVKTFSDTGRVPALC